MRYTNAWRRIVLKAPDCQPLLIEGCIDQRYVLDIMVNGQQLITKILIEGEEKVKTEVRTVWMQKQVSSNKNDTNSFWSMNTILAHHFLKVQKLGTC